MSIAKVLLLPYGRPWLYPEFIKKCIFISLVNKYTYKGNIEHELYLKRSRLWDEKLISDLWVFRVFIEKLLWKYYRWCFINPPVLFHCLSLIWTPLPCLCPQYSSFIADSIPRAFNQFSIMLPHETKPPNYCYLSSSWLIFSVQVF